MQGVPKPNWPLKNLEICPIEINKGVQVCEERSAKTAFKKQIAEFFWKKTVFYKEQPVS